MEFLRIDMKKRTAVIGALVSLLSMGQPLMIGTGSMLTSSALLLSIPEKVKASGMEGSASFNRAISHFESKNFSRAKQECMKGIEINSNDDMCYVMLGLIKSEFKDYQGAISDFTKAIEINPENSWAYGFRGTNKGMSGNDRGACVDTKGSSLLGNATSTKTFNKLCR